MTENNRCDICGCESGTIHLHSYSSEGKSEMHLCEACARTQEMGIEPDELKVADFFKNAAVNLFGDEAREDIKKIESLACPNCNLTMSQFEKVGLLGCTECYETFKEQLEQLLKRIHGSNKHFGAGPRPQRVIANSPDIEALKGELRAAIEQDNFERAAEYRDMIKNLESEPNRLKKSQI